MTGINLNLDESALKTAMQSAIMANITQTSRDDIIRQAVEYLTEERDQSGYGHGRSKMPSVLQSAFESACTLVAREIVHDHVQNSPEFRAAIGLAIDAMGRKVIENHVQIGEAAGHALASEIRAYYRKD